MTPEQLEALAQYHDSGVRSKDRRLSQQHAEWAAQLRALAKEHREKQPRLTEQPKPPSKLDEKHHIKYHEHWALISGKGSSACRDHLRWAAQLRALAEERREEQNTQMQIKRTEALIANETRALTENPEARSSILRSIDSLRKMKQQLEQQLPGLRATAEERREERQRLADAVASVEGLLPLAAFYLDAQDAWEGTPHD